MQTAPLMPVGERIPPGQNGFTFFLDKQSYLPGDKVQGQVQLNLKNPINARSLDLTFQGVEEVGIVQGSGKNAIHYSAETTMADTGVRLSEQATIPAGTTTFPFAFDIPANALPSYVGKYTSVTWKLSAKADIPHAHDIAKDLFLLVLNPSPQTPAPVPVENPEAEPKIRIGLSSYHYQPGEIIQGKLAVLNPGNMRGVRLQLGLNEYATGQARVYFMLKTAERTDTRPVGQPLEYLRDNLMAAQEIPFQIQLPAEAPCTYKGGCSSINWFLSVTLNIPDGHDIQHSIPFIVALRTSQAISDAPPASVSPRPATDAPPPLIAPAQPTG
jgi:Arrestin (or S-antigen), N-terminal domain